MRSFQRTGKFAGLLVGVFGFVGLVGLDLLGQDYVPTAKVEETSEVFHVGKVGQKGAVENREMLMALFQSISKRYNEKLKVEQAKNPMVFKGEKVRIIKMLNGNPPEGGRLFMVAYDGGPAVFVIKGDGKGKIKPGNLTPPLVIKRAGEHTSVITRRVKIDDGKAGKPVLESVEADAPTLFFGIPLDGGGGSSGGSSGSNYKTVKETKTLKKFQALVSTERIDNKPQSLSTAMFVKMLKNGEVFDVKRSELRRCQECGGFGRVLGSGPERGADGKIPCGDCIGAGKLKYNVIYRVTW